MIICDTMITDVQKRLTLSCLWVHLGAAVVGSHLGRSAVRCRPGCPWSGHVHGFPCTLHRGAGSLHGGGLAVKRCWWCSWLRHGHRPWPEVVAENDLRGLEVPSHRAGNWLHSYYPLREGKQRRRDGRSNRGNKMVRGWRTSKLHDLKGSFYGFSSPDGFNVFSVSILVPKQAYVLVFQISKKMFLLKDK